MMKNRNDANTTGINEARRRDEGRTSADTRSIKQIFQDIVSHVSDIIRSEVRLAKTEVSQDATRLAKAGAWIGVAALLGFYAIGFVLLSAMYALQDVMPSWLAALLVGVPVGVAAAILFVAGRKKLAKASLRPDKTIKTLEDDVTWFKRQTR